MLKLLQKSGFALAITGCMLTSASIAQPPPGFEGGPGRMMRNLPLMVALDADGNGEISSAEIDQATAALKKLDKDNDGKISAVELRPDFGPFGFGPREGRDAPDGPRQPAREKQPAGAVEAPADRPAAPGRDQAAAPGGFPEPRGGREFPGFGGPPGFGGFGGLGGSPEEFIDRLFQFDADKDGKLTREELSKMVGRMGPGRGRGEPGIGRGGEPTRPQRPPQ